jgi:hypothetical protein
MDVFGTLPGWAIVLLALLLAGIVLAQNIGWLLAARGLLDAARPAAPTAPLSEAACAGVRASEGPGIAPVPDGGAITTAAQRGEPCAARDVGSVFL